MSRHLTRALKLEPILCKVQKLTWISPKVLEPDESLVIKQELELVSDLQLCANMDPGIVALNHIYKLFKGEVTYKKKILQTSPKESCAEVIKFIKYR